MTDRNQCLLVNLYYVDGVSEFDKLLTDMKRSYIKTSFHSLVEGWCYKFIILNYKPKEQDAISSFLSCRDDVTTRQIVTLSDDQLSVLIDIIIK